MTRTKLTTTFLPRDESLETKINAGEAQIPFKRRHCREVLADRRIQDAQTLKTRDENGDMDGVEREEGESDADMVKRLCKMLEAME